MCLLYWSLDQLNLPSIPRAPIFFDLKFEPFLPFNPPFVDCFFPSVSTADQAAIEARQALARRETVVDRPYDGRQCAACNEPVVEGSKHYRVGVAHSELVFHTHCFVCSERDCKLALTRESFKEKDGRLFCATHFGVRFCPRCAACSQPILELEFSRALDQSWHPHCFACQFCRKVLEAEYVCDSSRLPYCDTSCYIAQVNRIKQQQPRTTSSSPNTSGKLPILAAEPTSPTSSSPSPSSSVKMRVRVSKSGSPSPGPSPSGEASPPIESPTRAGSPPPPKKDAPPPAATTASTAATTAATAPTEAISPRKQRVAAASATATAGTATTAAAAPTEATSPRKQRVAAASATATAASAGAATTAAAAPAAAEAISPRKQRLKVKQRRATTAPIPVVAPVPGAAGGAVASTTDDAYSVTRVSDRESGRDCEQCKAKKATQRLVITNNTVRVNVHACTSCADRIEANHGKLEPPAKGSPTKSSDALSSKKAKRHDAKVAKKLRRSKAEDGGAGGGAVLPNGTRTFDSSELKTLYAGARDDIAAATDKGKKKARTTDDVPARKAVRQGSRSALNTSGGGGGGGTGASVAPAAAAASAASAAVAVAQYEIREDTFITDLDQIALAAIHKRQAAQLKQSADASQSAAASGNNVWVAPKPSATKRERAFYAECRQAWNEQSPKAALAKLTSSTTFDATPAGVAKFLLVEHDRIDKVSLGEMLGRDEAPWRDVLREFLRGLGLRQHDFLFSLRRMIAQFRLPGEGQVINRIMETFAKVYCEHNKGFFKDADHAHTLAMLVLTLNTATHNPNEQRKITVDDWVSYCEELTASEPRCTAAYLEAIWQSIQEQEIRMPMEGMFPDMVRRGFLEHCEGTFARSWKSRWFVLSHSCLYMFDSPEDEDPRTIVPLHGIVARPSSKRANAFELCAGDAAASLVYTEKSGKDGKLKQGKMKTLLFAAATDKERDIWIADIETNKITGPTAVPLSHLLDTDDASTSAGSSAANSPRKDKDEPAAAAATATAAAAATTTTHTRRHHRKNEEK